MHFFTRNNSKWAHASLKSNFLKWWSNRAYYVIPGDSSVFAIVSDAANVSQDIGINVKGDNMKVPDWVHHFSLKTEQLNQVCRYIASIYYARVGAESL